MRALCSKPYRCAMILLALAFCGASRLPADVTIRYQTDFQLSAGMPPMIEQAMKPALAKTSSLSVRMKGSKAWSTSRGIVEIIDLAKDELTLVDPTHHTFATFPASEFAGKMAAAMPQIPAAQMKAMQDAMSSIKTKVDSKVTGRTDTIQGVQAEEREIDITMDLPTPAATPQTSPSVRLAMQIWNAKQGEALRVPAIRELTGFNLWQKYFLDPAGMIAKIAGKMPGIGEMVTPLLRETLKNQSVILRIHVEMYMPFMAKLAQTMAAQKGETANAIDPEAPIIQMNQEVVELTDAPVDASLFEVPKEYTAAPADEMIRGMARSESEKSARQRQYSTGQAHPPDDTDLPTPHVSLVQGHPLLVPAAKDAVQQWVYQPTLLNGQPVDVTTQVDVTFTLSQ